MNLTSYLANKCFEFFLNTQLQKGATLAGTKNSSSFPACFLPPWVLDAEVLTKNCDGCGNCIARCENTILVRDTDGCPQVDFSIGGCSFCGACVEGCAQDVFRREDSVPPWTLKARINADCLAHNNVLCGTCAEFCEYNAIIFSTTAGASSPPRIAADLCKGCGACFAPCPVRAIAIINTAGSEKS